MPTTRRFEFSEGSSSKFWEITLDGSSASVRYGKIGTPGQEKAKSYASAAQAEADAKKQIAEKTGKGYKEVTTSAAVPQASLDEAQLAEFLNMIEADPDKPESYLVFADWLSEAGHPWGELIALHHAIATAPNASKKAELQKQETAFLQAKGASILGDELARAGRPTRFVWSYGFVREALIASPTNRPVLKERLEGFFAKPCTRLLGSLTVHAEPDRMDTVRDWDNSPDQIVNPWTAMLPVLASAPPSMKTLRFGDTPPRGASGYVELPNLKALAEAAPKLEVLEMQGDTAQSLAVCEFPRLKKLVIRAARMESGDLTTISQLRLPDLERLSLWIGGLSYCTLDDIYEAEEWDEDNEDALRYPTTYPSSDLDKMEIYDVNMEVNAAELRTFLNGPFPEKLNALGINSLDFTPEHLSAICQSAVVTLLKELDLSGGSLQDTHLPGLVAEAGRLKHLEKIDVSRNCLTAAGLKRLQEALPKVVSTGQRTDRRPEFVMRYVATME
jgi:uncharacterized protein (TIGR02996 family)